VGGYKSLRKIFACIFRVVRLYSRMLIISYTALKTTIYMVEPYWFN